MAFDLMSYLIGVASGIFLAIIIKIFGKIKNRNKNPSFTESQYIPQPQSYSQGITPKPIFEMNNQAVKRFIRG